MDVGGSGRSQFKVLAERLSGETKKDHEKVRIYCYRAQN
jgi:hypothetical protein